ncbi:hypothetical protein V4U86_08600 [Mycobacterium sp. AMU20-3851]|uniref:hypothetical protein n=1 Tax=Mycobacterium sp. AMU20-3851 TaxID=3122055 RepID=UPI00375516D9
MDRYEQWPADPRSLDPEYAQRWLQGDWIHMNQREQEEFLRYYGTRRQRRAIKKLWRERNRARQG